MEMGKLPFFKIILGEIEPDEGGLIKGKPPFFLKKEGGGKGRLDERKN